MPTTGAVDFVQRYPKLYHVSQAPSVETIRRHGLLSTTAILNLLEVQGDERLRLQHRQRPTSVPLAHPVQGDFVLNDQSPLNLKGLSRCLIGMAEHEWIAELNRRVFFFPSLPKLKSLANAMRTRELTKIILEYTTKDLLQLEEDRLSIASINTGYTLRKPALRGPQTFLPLSAYAQRPRPRVAEVTVMDLVPPGISFRVVNAST